jgi:hypothetical protein
MWTAAEALPATIRAATEAAWLAGIANAWVVPEVIWNCDDAAVSMPIQRTARVAWLEGYVGADQPGQLLGDAGLPVAAAGVPPLPAALPRASTFSPVFTADEWPRATVLSPDAAVSCRTAMSWLWS